MENRCRSQQFINLWTFPTHTNERRTKLETSRMGSVNPGHPILGKAEKQMMVSFGPDS